jgi:hypothetical protein
MILGIRMSKIDLSEKEKAIECIKALSRIEGSTMSMGGLSNRDVFIDNIDYIMKYFEELLKELDR